MQKEIEVKILNVNVREIRRKLGILGAISDGPAKLCRELYWSGPVQDKKYYSLRLRQEGKSTFLNLKFRTADKNFKIYDEFEVEVSDFQETRKILQSIGCKVLRDREKVRETYRLGRAKIEIDEYPNMKPYIEIEANGKSKIRKIVAQLGLDFTQTTNKTATGVIKDYGLDPNNLRFSRKRKL